MKDQATKENNSSAVRFFAQPVTVRPPAESNKLVKVIIPDLFRTKVSPSTSSVKELIQKSLETWQPAAVKETETFRRQTICNETKEQLKRLDVKPVSGSSSSYRPGQTY